MAKNKIVGRIMADIENGEADLVLDPRFFQEDPLWQADIMQDALGDAARLYNEAVQRMRDDWAAANARRAAAE